MTPTPERLEAVTKRGHKIADKVGNFLVDGFHTLALFAIGATIVWSAAFAFFAMVKKGHASVEDILLLFIFLELGAMVGIYFKTNHMPVRFLIYVAITALTRWLIGLANVEHLDPADVAHALDMRIIIITGSILLLALANLVLRFASFKYPSAGPLQESGERPEADRPA